MGLHELYNEVFSDEIEKVAEAEEVAALETEYEDMEKIAEDYISAGRFMARGYMDEMEKLAGKMEALKALPKKAWEFAKGAPKKAYEGVKAAPGKYVASKKQALEELKGFKKVDGKRELKKGLKGAARLVGPEAGLAGLAYGGYKLKKHMED